MERVNQEDHGWVELKHKEIKRKVRPKVSVVTLRARALDVVIVPSRWGVVEK